jgi:alanyl aminopeptidase
MNGMVYLSRCVATVCCAIVLVGLGGEAVAKDDWPQGRLPAVVVPLEYDLQLTIIPDQPRFGGLVEIRVELQTALTGFWLHGRHLDVSNAEVIPAKGSPVTGRYTERGEDGVAWLELADEVPAGPAVIRIEYGADFEAGLNGIYKVLVGEDAYAFTQFESIHARKAFPGFDEPAYKTPFNISVTTRAGYEALSNTRVIRRENLAGGLQRLTYARTEPLPTYLVAFAVGPLDVVAHAPVPPNSYRKDPLPLRGVAAKGQGARLQYALENTAPIVTELERYFGRAYPFDKLDIVAVPDFAGGAMENAGLITYREGILLFDEPAPFEQQRWFGMIHAHELGHQWFGNLVTMPWWDDIWLNEAFAAWIQARVARVWRPDFRLDQFVQSAALRAMANDSLVSARQIREPVTDADDIVAAFDTITYQKGAAVLQMFESYLGEDVFRAGIQTHMQRFAFGSATVDDLIDSLEQAAPPDKPLREPFESFLFQPGVPYLNVSTACEQNEVSIKLRQQRYLPIGSRGRRDMRWQVPVCATFGYADERAQHCRLLTETEQSFSVPVEQCPQWVMPNAGGNGYYRWVLETGTATLADHFLTGLNGGERLAFVDSLAAAVAAGDVPPATFLARLPLFAQAPEPLAVSAAANAYEQMLDFLVSPAQMAAARAYGMRAFAGRLAGLANEKSLTESERAMLRQRLTEMLALALKDEATRRRLKQQAYALLGYDGVETKTAQTLDPDLLEVGLIVAVQDSPADFTQFLIDHIRGSLDARRRYAGVRALAHATDEEALDLGRKFALSGDMRGSDFQAWAGMLLNADSGAANWAWLQADIRSYMQAASERARREAPAYFSMGLCSDQDARRLRTMFVELENDYGLNERKLNQGIETVQLCSAAKAQLAPAVNAYLSSLGTSLQ